MILENTSCYTSPVLLVATPFMVDLHKTDSSQQEMFSHMTNIHHVIGSPVTCMDVRSSPCQLAVGLGSFGGSLDPYRVWWLYFFYLRMKMVKESIDESFNKEYKKKVTRVLPYLYFEVKVHNL